MSEIDVLKKELKDKNEFIKNILGEMKDTYEALDRLRSVSDDLKVEFRVLARLINE